MSIVVAPQRPPRHYGSVLRSFVSTRGLEVSVLQASPLLGAYLGGLGTSGHDLGRLAWLLLGSLALTAHVFAFNDWAGYAGDARDLRQARFAADGATIGRERIGVLAAALLVPAAIGLGAVGTPALLVGAAIAALSLLYSSSPRLGKSQPIAASLNHLIGGALHFLLGYTAVRGVDATGVALSVFFGLVFAAGHLNQEVRDHDADLANGIRTSAVTFGCRPAALASFGLFSTAYLLIIGLAAFGVVTRVLLLGAVAWGAQAGWSLRALRGGLGFETAVWLQRRYRMLFALVGVAMLIR